MERQGRVVRILQMEKVEFSAVDIVEEFGRVSKDSSLVAYMNKIISRMKENGQVRTSETYRSTLNRFYKFRGGRDILIDHINRDVVESYEIWLKHKGLALNTISFYLRILRAVYYRAVEEHLTDDRHPFKSVYTGIEKTIKRALPIDTLKKIRITDLSMNKGMDYARDMFILSFMLRGMSLLDMAFLKKSDLNDGKISYRRRKTGQKLTIEWTSEMQAILDKYPAHHTKYLLPIIRSQKSIPIYAYRHMNFNINRMLKKVGKKLHLPISLTMYVARHSWATAAKSKGIPISVISEGLGHDSETTTQIYLASLETSVVDYANSLLLKELNSE